MAASITWQVEEIASRINRRSHVHDEAKRFEGLPRLPC
ncbi:hypothetical protein LMG29542_08729 [Paraburkholderia humisilvae]|uniref:Uncharacterized protein n=1 Tax=Paraburkholderia humisilvae TaxID=627669 RepID=A0A6J5FD01_9BURK|nr:hypothetical protein LMG29542_08729 [Paraburkholderia humisilvae]